MRLTIKGQVTIPKRLRTRYGFNPQEEVIIEEAPGGVLIRPAGPTRSERIHRAVIQVRGIADVGLTTDQILKSTREE